MTEHLRECWATYPSDPPAWCICDELRACEQRVLGDRDEIVGITAVKSFRAGLDAAREAVVALPMMKIAGNFPLYDADEVIAAIDALQGEKP